ncbi:MAG: response regulator [Treponema sp.]|nr:response regulator [Treponema sp.]
MEYILSHPKIYFDLAALVFDILMCVLMVVKYYQSASSRRFRILVLTITLACICEIIRVLVGDLPYTPGTNLLKRIFYSLCFITSMWSSYAYASYVIAVAQDFKSKKLWWAINLTFAHLVTVILLANIKTGWVATYSEVTRYWARGPLYIAMGYIPPCYYMVFILVLFLRYFKKYSRTVRILIFSSLFVTAAAMVLQPFTNGKLTLVTFGMTLANYLWYMAMENADYQNLLLITNELEFARTKAQEASRAKSTFLANMSHEIRTPMNAVLGLDEMILNSRDKSEINEYARNIQSSGKALLAIINDILDFSKIESGKMELSENEYHLCDMLDDVILQTSMRATRQKLDFHTDVEGEIPEHLYGDEFRLRQILTNILNNAIKYTKQGSITLKVRAFYEKKRVSLLIEVSDTGIGIRQSDLPKIFQSFERVDEMNLHMVEGTGLGLSIVHRLITLMGGTIDVESEIGRGSTFTITIPQVIVGNETISSYRKINEMTRTRSITDEKWAPDAKVLVVDDNTVNLIVAKGFLARTHAQITTCESGAACLELMQKERYDIIFLDHMMPEMDGVQVLNLSRTLPGNKNLYTPIVALTANAISGMREKYLALGFTDYVSKPIDSKVFFEVFYRLISPNLIQDAKETPDEAPVAEKKSDVKYLDPEKGIEFCGGDSDLYHQLLEQFVGDRDETQIKLAKFLMLHDWENYRIIVHGLKSNGRTLGADSFADMAADMEKACRSILEPEKAGDVDEIEGGYKNWENYIEENHDVLMELYTNVAVAALNYIREPVTSGAEHD